MPLVSSVSRTEEISYVNCDTKRNWFPLLGAICIQNDKFDLVQFLYPYPLPSVHHAKLNISVPESTSWGITLSEVPE